MRTINWGIIGCGDVTEVKSGPAFGKVAGSRLVAVMRRDACAAKDYARRHRVPRWYSDAHELIKDPEVSAVYIATPPNVHANLAIKVAAAGKPCYVEKPMARTANECRSMLEAFEAARQPLYVAYYRRALPHFSWVKSLIDSDKMGTLHALRYDFASSSMVDSSSEGWRFDPGVAGGGLYWDLGSHALDLFDHWVGPLGEVQGQLLNKTGQTEVEEIASLIARSATGVAVSASWNFISTESRDCVLLEFEKGVVRCSIFGPPNIRVINAMGEESVETFELNENIQFNLIENVIASIRTGAPPLSTGSSALRTNEVIDAVARS